MNNTLFTILIVVLSVGMIGCNDGNSQTEKTKKKAVFIILDGISSDVLEKIDTPNLDEISTAGNYTRAYVGGEAGTHTETPTISAVGYNSLLTGTWVNKHNVWGNGIKNPNYNYWNIFRILKHAAPEKKTAIFSTWLDNRTKLIGEGLENAGSITMDYAFDGFEYDTINFPHDDDRQYIYRIDEHVSKEAARYIKTEAPDLSWVYLEFTDDMGHRYGDSEQFYKAIRMADAQVGRVWRAITERASNFNEEWMIVVTTDHGRTASNGKGHGGQTDRERASWIVTNHTNTNDYFMDVPGVVDIMPGILKHLDIEIPKKILREIDGVSIIGNVSIGKLKSKKTAAKITLTWKNYGEESDVEIFLTTTNEFRKGGADNYIEIGTAKASEEYYEIDVSEYKSAFYKIVVKAKHNSVNSWIIEE